MFRRKKAQSKLVTVKYGPFGNPHKKRIEQAIEKASKQGYDLAQRQDVPNKRKTELTFVLPTIEEVKPEPKPTKKKSAKQSKPKREEVPELSRSAVIFSILTIFMMGVLLIMLFRPNVSSRSVSVDATLMQLPTQVLDSELTMVAMMSAEPSATITNTPEPTAIITNTVEPTVTITSTPVVAQVVEEPSILTFDDADTQALHDAILAMDEVASIEIFSTESFDSIRVFGEITVQTNMVNENVANQIIDIAVNYYPNAESVDIFLADGVNVPFNYYWQTSQERLTITEMQINAPASAASVEGVTEIPITIGEIISQANIRTCPQANEACSVVATLVRGQDGLIGFPINGSVTGEAINGNSLWYRGAYDGQEVYVHSSLVILGGSNQSSNTSSETTNAGPTALPRPSNCAEAVEWGYTAEQAAQWSHLDRDNDGVACYGD